MKKEMFIFLVALIILGGAFSAYLEWLHAQPKSGVAQIKMPPPSPRALFKPDMTLHG